MMQHALLNRFPDVPRRMRGLVDELTGSAPGVPHRAWINRCTARQSLRRVVFERPTVLLAALGRKDVIVDNAAYSSMDGSILLVPAGLELGIENIPNGGAGLFVGTAIGFDSATLSQFRSLYGNYFSEWDLTPRWAAPYSDKLVSALVDWLAWTRRFPAFQVEARHRLMEILLLVATQGAAGNLLLDHGKSLSARLRAFLALDPSRNWSAAEASHHIGISVSSLRRKLGEQKTGFRQLLEDVRLGKGLELVLNTDLQIGQIAHACGYESQSRFSERFRLRFSMSPTEIRRSRSDAREDPGKPATLALYRRS